VLSLPMAQALRDAIGRICSRAAIPGAGQARAWPPDPDANQRAEDTAAHLRGLLPGLPPGSRPCMRLLMPGAARAQSSFVVVPNDEPP
jgi:hypothetical protein